MSQMTSTSRVLRGGVSVCLLAFSLPMLAQRTYVAGKIIFKNPGEFTQNELETVMGMHVGDSFKQDDLNAAAQRLSDSGYFDNVGGALEGMTNKINVTIDLNPSTHAELLHAGFHNFIWLTPQEITTALRDKLPLYRGYLPEVGGQMEKADEVLMAALAANGVTASVQHETIEPSLEHPERVVEFVIVKPSIKVSNVKLAGVSESHVPYLQKSVNATAKTSYNAGLAGKSTVVSILEPLLDAGYVNATLSDVEVTPTTGSDGNITVVMASTLSADGVYHVGTISFAGAPLMSAEEFAAGAKLHAGDVASHKLLMGTIAPLDAAYRRKGYMDVIASATPTLDKAALKVDYAVTLVPGEPYHLREVMTQGLEGDAQAKSEFDRSLLMKTGDLYNPYAIIDALKKDAAPPALRPYSATFKAQADPATHVVDVLITFYKTGAR
jgi:outer membrane protein assembly factor BamA